MSTYDLLNGLIAETQAKNYGLNAISELAAREFGYADRIMRELDYTDRIMREIEPFPGLREHAESAFSRYAQDLQTYDKLAQRLRPLITEQIVLEQAYLQKYTSSLAQSHAILSQFTAQAVADHVAAFDVSRIVAEINKQSAVAQAMGAFTASIVRDANLRDGLLSGLASVYAAIPPNTAPLATFNYDQLFRTIVTGFDEVGLTHFKFSYETIVWRFEGWLKSHPPNVRKVLIGLLLIVAQIALQETVNFCKHEPKLQPALHEHQAATTGSERGEADTGDMCH